MHVSTQFYILWGIDCLSHVYMRRKVYYMVTARNKAQRFLAAIQRRSEKTGEFEILLTHTHAVRNVLGFKTGPRMSKHVAIKKELLLELQATTEVCATFPETPVGIVSWQHLKNCLQRTVSFFYSSTNWTLRLNPLGWGSNTFLGQEPERLWVATLVLTTVGIEVALFSYFRVLRMSKQSL